MINYNKGTGVYTLEVDNKHIGEYKTLEAAREALYKTMEVDT